MTASEIYEKLSENGRVYQADTPGDIEEFFNSLGALPTVKKKKGKKYYNVAAAFDTETTSFEESNGDRVGTMYIWILDINGLIIYGRTWEYWQLVYYKLVEHFKLEKGFVFPIYVHNLPFDFQFFHKWHDWQNIFALQRMEPIRALTVDGVEFRCSYKLSGLSLANVGKNLIKYPVQKMVGDLDYSLIRHSETPLTEKELGYCFNDVRVVVSYILEQIADNNNDVTEIPMTNTGYVRRYVRSICFGMDIEDERTRNKQYKHYKELMNSLTLTPDEYEQLRRAFAGGFTHASAWTVLQPQENVTSLDECSAYPAQMLAQKFPMSEPEIIENINKEEFRKSLRLYCCLFDLRIVGLEERPGKEHCLASSKCRIPKFKAGTKELNKYFCDNGKLVQADELYTTVTETDFRILEKFYKWKFIQIGIFRRYTKGYLPTAFVKAILTLYMAKTELKGRTGYEAEYLLKKGMLNSAYGMAVTNILRDIINYDMEDNMWGKNEKPDIVKVIDDYNKSSSRFLSYAWGVWITSYARAAVLDAVDACGDDYCYTDTDSVKFKNYEAHKAYFEAYNEAITEKLRKAMEYHMIPFEQTRPKTKKGEEKPIGIFEPDGFYIKFKSAGAKRYLVEHEDHEVVLTVSGLKKFEAVCYMMKATNTKYHIETDEDGVKHIIADEDTTNLFEYFNDELTVPASDTGKNLHTYFDHEIAGVLTDYLGNTADYNERSGVNLSPVGYSSNENTIWLNYVFERARLIYDKN